jgi:release factor glutamine methyltransferase
MQNQQETKASQWTILKLLKWTTSYFKSHKIDSPRAAAEILLSKTLKLERIDLYLRYDQPLCAEELNLFKECIKRRVNREPVAYIAGVKEFWSMDLSVTGDVLIPRPETECLVEAALSMLPVASSRGLLRILELGTGSGAVILALTSQRPGHFFFASDRSTKAVAMARENIKRYELNHTIHIFCGNWFQPLKANSVQFDMIVTNPPYIPTRVIPQLEPEIYKYEPAMALDGGEDGLDSIRHIIHHAYRYLNPGGNLLLEMDHGQKNAVGRIIDACGQYEKVVFIQDYSGYDRVVQMKKRTTSNERKSGCPRSKTSEAMP